MTETIYLVFTKSGFIVARKTPGFNLDSGQRAVKLEVRIPDQAFEPDPVLRFSVEVPTELILRPAVEIAAEVDQPEGVS